MRNDSGLIPRIRLHDLRHTRATLMLADGTNPRIVSERLGHHSTACTLDTYVHVIPGLQRQAAQQAAEVRLDPIPEPDRSTDVGLG